MRQGNELATGAAVSGAVEAVEDSSGPDRTLEALLERVKGATGPLSRDDAALAAFEVGWLGADENLLRRALEGSLDAVVALCERLCPWPEWVWRAGNDFGLPGHAHLACEPFAETARPLYYTATGATPALALLAALLEALVKSRSPSLAGG